MKMLEKSFPYALKKGKIKNSQPMTFDNNQFAYFSIASKIDYLLFKDLIRKYKPSLFRTLFALKRSDNILSYGEIYKIAGCSNDETAHSVKLSSIINDLVFLGIVKTIKFSEIEFIYHFGVTGLEERLNQKVQQLINNTTQIILLLNWLHSTNILSSREYLFVGEANNYLGVNKNSLFWDAFGFTNTVGLGQKHEDYQTIVIVDFLFGQRYEQYDFEGFRTRTQIIINSVKSEKRKVLPIVIAQDFSPSALQNIKSNSYICFNITSILGENSNEIINEYNLTTRKFEEIIENNGIEDFNNDIKLILDHIESTGLINNYGNLIGHLFEYLMLPVLQKIYNFAGVRFIHNYKGKTEGKQFECDYYIDAPEEDIFIELKGYRNGNVIPLGKYDVENDQYDKDTLKWFLNHTFQLCKKTVSNGRHKFCYITTADFEEDALKVLIDKDKSKEKPDRLSCYYNYSSLLQLLDKFQMYHEMDIIKQFFSRK